MSARAPRRRGPIEGEREPERRTRRLTGGTHQGPSPIVFGFLSIVLGVVAGVGAFAFRAAIALVHNLAFLGHLSLEYDTNQHTAASPWGLAVALVPAAGALVVVLLVRRLAPETKGPGVSEVLDAIYYGKAEIRGVVAAVKALASAISIGTGGSVGREGPIVQIGAALGSVGGRWAGVSRWQRATLVAAGGGAGIAATFNTPVGGILFAVEVLLPEVSVRTLVPVALAATTATYVGRGFFGDTPAFPVPEIGASERLSSLPGFVVLGLLCTLASVLLIRSLYGAEDLFERALPGRPYLRHFLGMLGVGALFAMLFSWQGHYYVDGVGYSTIVDVLTSPESVGLLVTLFFLKAVATCATLGSGASGGVFSPSLFMGATLGGAYGLLVGPLLAESPAIFALAGMAGMLAGTTGAVLTAMVMLFEMTLDYSMILPIGLTAAVSYGLRRLLLAESIYTMKLARRGHDMPKALQANAFLVHHVSDVTTPRVSVVDAGATAEELVPRGREDDPECFVIVGEGEVVGVVPREWALAHRGELTEGRSVLEVPAAEHVIVEPSATIFDLLALLQREGASVAVVVAPEDAEEAGAVLGVVTKAHIAEALAEGMEMFED